MGQTATTSAKRATPKQIFVGEEIIAGRNQHYRVVDLVEFDEQDESPFVGLLKVEAA